MNIENIYQRLAHKAWLILVTCLFISGNTIVFSLQF